MDADNKAKEYQQQQLSKAHQFVLMSPQAGAFVTIPEGTITAKVIPELRNYATEPSLLLRLWEMYSCNPIGVLALKNVNYEGRDGKL